MCEIHQFYYFRASSMKKSADALLPVGV